MKNLILLFSLIVTFSASYSFADGLLLPSNENYGKKFVTQPHFEN